VSRPDAPLGAIRTRAFKIPTDKPEADGTFAWDATTLILVEVEGGGSTGLGYTYADASVAGLIDRTLAKTVAGIDALDPPRAWTAMQIAVRNLGRSGLAATAISALDAALWDLKAKLLGLPLALLLGRARDAVPVYGSGGFTTYTDDDLRAQLRGWVERDGCAAVKMKIGSDPGRDPHRVSVAKAAIGDAQLFVDANGAFSAKHALAFAHRFVAQDVRWFEEPVTSDDLPGLALVRRRGPPGMDIAAGEYAFHPDDVAAMLGAGAVDCQQADLTRCGGVTGFLRVAALCDAHHVDLSGHCAPAIHLHAACAAPRLRHLEWFHDHVRIEQMLFDGAPIARGGTIRPDLSRLGHGLAFKSADAAPFEQ
jgi:L-alanine-DL-glutamate epimerase-like enolase superfamily enzyme